MKTIKIFALCAIAAVAMTACSGKTSNEKNPAGITNSDVDQVSYMVGHQFGQYIKGNNFGALSFAQIEKGIKDAIAGVEVDEETFYNTMNEYMEKRMNALKEVNEAAAAKFFEENGKKEGVVTTESGLQYKIIRAGNGVKPFDGSTVKVCYEGKLLDGTGSSPVGARASSIAKRVAKSSSGSLPSWHMASVAPVLSSAPVPHSTSRLSSSPPRIPSPLKKNLPSNSFEHF